MKRIIVITFLFFILPQINLSLFLKFCLFILMTPNINEYADEQSQLCYCVDIAMTPFLSAYTCGDFVKPNKEWASQRHFQENNFHKSIIKSLPFAVLNWKPHFLPLLLWLVLSISYCNWLITGTLYLPLLTMIPNKFYQRCHLLLFPKS